MRKADIIAFLEAEISTEQLSTLLAEEVRAHRRALEVRGMSAPVVLTGGEKSIAVGAAHLRRLGNAILNSELSRPIASYVLDAMTLSPDFVWPSEEAFDAAAQLSECSDQRVPELVHELLEALDDTDWRVSEDYRV